MTDVTPNQAINEHIQGSSLTAPIELIELDATALGGGIYRFAPMPIQDFIDGKVNMTPIEWQGESWPPFPFQTSDWAWDGTGSLPTPQVEVANVNGYFTAANIEFNNLLGVQLTRFRTFAKFLDGMPDADPEAQYPPEIYTVSMKVSQNNTTVTWQLSTDLDHQNAQIPARIVLKNACTQTYRVYDTATHTFDYSQATCPYTGGNYFKPDGTRTTDPTLDMCSFQLNTGCKARFGNSPLPTRAFPGAGQTPPQ